MPRPNVPALSTRRGSAVIYRIYPLTWHGALDLPVGDRFNSGEEAVAFAHPLSRWLPHGFEIWDRE